MPRRKRKVRRSLQHRPRKFVVSIVLQYVELQIHKSALKHGVSEFDIHHAYKNSTGIFKLDQESFETKVLIVGPDFAGNLLEVIGLEKADENLLIIHAMKIRKSIVLLIEKSS